MRFRNPWIYSTFIFLIGGLFCSLKLYKENLSLAHRLEKLSKTHAEEIRQVAVLRATLSQATRSLERDQSKESKSGPITKKNQTLEKRFTDPTYGRIIFKDRLRDLDHRFGRLLANLNLKPEILDKLRNLMISEEFSVRDAQQLALDSGLNSADSFLAGTQVSNEFSNEIQNLIGQNAYNQLISGEKIADIESSISDKLGVDLTSAGVPLSSDQLNALAQIYAKNLNAAHIPTAISWSNEIVDPNTGLTPTYQTMLDQATTVVAPQQLPFIKQQFQYESQLHQYYFSHPANP